jgi:DNA-binding transcriptional MerR regulator
MVATTYSTKQVAWSVEPPAHNTTVIRYAKEGVLGEIRRNERGQRRFTHEQLKKFKALFEARNR